jgi:hemerythrin
VSSFIAWREDWLLGIADVDDEHRKLVALLNRIAERRCCGSDAGPARPDGADSALVVTMLAELGEEVRKHFRNEEGHMQEAGYPDYDDHRYEHLELLAEFAELMRDIERGGLECLDAATLESLKNWLLGHLAGADKRFGDYYRALVHGRRGRERDAFSRRWMRLSLGD